MTKKITDTKRNTRIHYESESENEDEDFKQNYRGDYVDSDDGDEQKDSSGVEEGLDKMKTSHNSVKKLPKKKLRIEANKNNTRKQEKCKCSRLYKEKLM